MYKKDIFTDVFKRKLWAGSESVSGNGSSLDQTATIRREIPSLLRALQIKTMLDAPCGDFHWMKNTPLELDRYIGVDIVPELIDENNRKYSDSKKQFVALDITTADLPQVDLILCRDCFVHLSFTDIWSALNGFKRSGSRYLLTTTFTNVTTNTDIQTGMNWRPINLQLPPFSFPQPITIINENCTEGEMQFTDKSLALWALQSL